MIHRIEFTPEPNTLKLDGNDIPLVESLAVINHSPTGFSVGYAGSGPAQTALALLLRVMSREVAVALHQEFESEVVSGWAFAGCDVLFNIEQWVDDKLSDRDAGVRNLIYATSSEATSNKEALLLQLMDELPHNQVFALIARWLSSAGKVAV